MAVVYICCLLVAVGTGLAASSMSSLIFDKAKDLIGRVKNMAKTRRMQKESRLTLVEKLIKEKAKSNNNEDIKYLVASGVAGGFFIGMAMPGWYPKFVGFVLGACAGMFIYMQYDRMKRGGDKTRQLKEAVLLHDAVDVFTSYGYSVQQALEKSLPVLKTLRPAVERCLSRYPYEPVKSIIGLGDDLKFEEAGTLVSILLQLHTDGARMQQFAKDGSNNSSMHITGSEAVRLEKIRRSITRTSIALRPTYQQFRLYLPLIAGASLIFYCMIRHVQVQFGSLTGANAINQLIK